MTVIRPRPGDLEAACQRHQPVPSGERVTALGPELCDLCGLSWGSPMHDLVTPVCVSTQPLSGETR